MEAVVKLPRFLLALSLSLSLPLLFPVQDWVKTVQEAAASVVRIDKRMVVPIADRHWFSRMAVSGWLGAALVLADRQRPTSTCRIRPEFMEDACETRVELAGRPRLSIVPLATATNILRTE